MNVDDSLLDLEGSPYVSPNEGTKFQIFRLLVEIDNISPPKFRFSEIFRLFLCFFLLFFGSKNLKKMLLP